LTHSNCSLSLKQKHTFLWIVFSTYTMEEIWQLAHDVQQRCCPLYQRQRNTVRSRMECTRRSPLFRRYQCAQEHPLFYALPSISRYKRKMETRAKGGDFSDDPSSANQCSSQTHFHSITCPASEGRDHFRRLSSGPAPLHCCSACSSWPSHHLDLGISSRIRHLNLTRATGTSVDPTADSKRHALLSAHV